MAERAEHAIMYYPGSFMGAVNGSQVRALGLLAFLQANFPVVTVYSLASDPPWEAGDVDALGRKFRDVRLVVEREGPVSEWAGRFKRLALTLAPGSGRSILSMRVAGQSPRLDRLLAEEPNSILCVNYVDNLSRLNGIDAARCVVETHDIQFLRRSIGVGRKPYSLASFARLRMEFGAVGAVAAAVGITRNETYLLRNLAPRTPSFYVPEFDPSPPVDSGTSSGRYDLLFVASSNIINQRGLHDLLSRTDLDLARYRIAVCGSLCAVPSIQLLAAQHSNIDLLGYVDDLLPLYAETRACLSPTTGTGLNIKMLEALRHGRPVFASRQAMDGLAQGFGECVFPISRSEFAGLLDDPDALAQAGRAAHDYYRSFTKAGDLVDYVHHIKRLTRTPSRVAEQTSRVSSAA